VVFQQLMMPGDEIVAAPNSMAVDQSVHPRVQELWLETWLADPDDVGSFDACGDAAHQGDLHRIDRQSLRTSRHRGDCSRCAQAGVPLIVEQHAGDALSDPPDRSRRDIGVHSLTKFSAATAIRSAASSSMPAPSTGRRATNIRC